jgi:hypothetical protein
MTLMPLPEKQPTKRETDGWIDNLVGALTDPIIVFPNDWKNDIPEELKKQIPMERLIMNMKVEHEGKGVPVGDIEALVCMFPRSMEAPMSDQQMRLYTYCFTQAMKFRKIEPPADLKRETLDNYDMSQLNDLKRFIWDRRVKARKEKARGETKAPAGETKAPAGETKKKELEVEVTQPSFF